MQTARQILRESAATVDAVEEFLHNLDEARQIRQRKGESKENFKKRQDAQTEKSKQENKNTVDKSKEKRKKETEADKAQKSEKKTIPVKDAHTAQENSTKPAEKESAKDAKHPGEAIFDRFKNMAADRQEKEARKLSPKEAKHFGDWVKEKLPGFESDMENAPNLASVARTYKGAKETMADHANAVYNKAFADDRKVSWTSLAKGQHTLADVAKQHPYATAGAVIGAGLLGRHMLKQSAKRKDRAAMYNAMYAQPQMMQQPMQQGYAQYGGQSYGQQGYGQSYGY